MKKLNNNKKIFICATEQSGDNIGVQIIKELLEYNSEIIFDGLGGSKMQSHLNNQYFSIDDFKSIGIIEIIFSIKKYFRMISFLSKKIMNNKYDLIITIDSPDFNYPLTKKLRKMKFNNPIIQIVAPTVWAWRKSRAKKFAKVYDEIFTLFKFENNFFEKHHLKTTFIGHPVYYIKNHPNNNENKNIIAFLPGSRKQEVEKLFPYFEIAYRELLFQETKIEIFIPTLPHLKSLIDKKINHWKIKTNITTNVDEIESLFLKTKFAVVCSGTASLEIAKRLIPQLIIYKLNYLTELIAKIFVKVKFANIINIIQNKMIISELTNSNLTKSSFKKEFISLIHNKNNYSNQILEIKESLNKIESDEAPFQKAANRIIDYL